MEEQTTGEGGQEMSVTSLVIHPQVMIEKWLLVFLIIGCTSLVFLICFPIDFYLYRRRKRLARERNKILFYKMPETRAGIGRAYTKTDTFDFGTDIETNEETVKKFGGFRAAGGLTRLLSSIRKKRDESGTMNHIRLTESRSDNSSDFQITTSLDTCQTGDTAGSKTVHSDENVQDKNTNEVSIVFKSEGNIHSLNANEYPSTFISSGRKFSNVSAAWSEHENLADSEIQRQNDESLKTSSADVLTKEPSNIKWLTIHVGSIDMVDIKGGYVGESTTEDRDTEPNGKGMCKVKLNSSSSVFHKEYQTTIDKANALENKRNSIVTLHPNREGLEGLEIHRVGERRYKKKKLKHSRSDQCILYESFEQIYPTPKGKKRNIVSPSSAPTLHSPEHCDSGVKPDNEVTIKQRSVSLSTHIEGDEEFIPHKTRKKKRQSMPALK